MGCNLTFTKPRWRLSASFTLFLCASFYEKSNRNNAIHIRFSCTVYAGVHFVHACRRVYLCRSIAFIVAAGIAWFAAYDKKRMIWLLEWTALEIVHHKNYP